MSGDEIVGPEVIRFSQGVRWDTITEGEGGDGVVGWVQEVEDVGGRFVVVRSFQGLTVVGKG